MVFLGFLLCEQQFKHGGGCQNGSFTFLLSPHTKGRRRGSCVIPSASITSKSHDNTINPHFPSLYSWLPPSAAPPTGTCRPAGFHLAARRFPSAAPPAFICRPGGCHLPPRRLPFGGPRASIWRLPSAANPNRMNHSSRNRDLKMLD